MLILITGTPGTGKTAVATELSKRINAEIIDLKRLAVKEKFLEGYDFFHKSMIMNEKRISNAVKKYIKKGKNYVLESHLAQFVKPNLTKLCIILRCNPLVLKKRLNQRGYSKIKVNENVMCEFLDAVLIEAIKLGHKNHLHEIDTTKRNAKSIANEIIDVLYGKKKKCFGKIEWLK